MSSPGETDALIELLVQLKKIVGTVPDQAKTILTSQPPLAYSLIKLMVEMKILSAEVLQTTLASAANPQPVQPAAPTPMIPAPIASNGHSQPATPFQLYSVPQSYQPIPPAPHPVLPSLSYPAAAPQTSTLPPSAQAMLAAIPEDQRNMVIQILSYTPEQINQLAPAERGTFMQLRATFGIPT